jgi:hypothetical protein
MEAIGPAQAAFGKYGIKEYRAQAEQRPAD